MSESQAESSNTISSKKQATKQSWEISQRAVAVACKAIKMKNSEITILTGMPERTIQSVYKKARKRGFDPSMSKVVLDAYVIDAPRSGRPPISDDIKKQVESKVQRDCYGRKKSCWQIGLELGISPMSV
ncbi:hypothetical protein DFH27DRAFT_480308 [Peziza echinospora]|nr:hypothetical protein DFH27DRAFT_480308 [Peziza echinospora]